MEQKHNLEEAYLRGAYFAQIEHEFYHVDTLFPDFLATVSESEKKKNEQYLSHYVNQISKLIRENKGLPKNQLKRRKKFSKITNHLLQTESIIGLPTAMDKNHIQDFQVELLTFIRNGRSFAPELKFEELLQGIRNYLVYGVFRELCGMEQCCKPSIFGYSMLYPFTDNYIDDETLNLAEKDAYNQFIQNCIYGIDLGSVPEHYKKTYDLLSNILEEAKDNSRDDLKTLLFHMLKAQSESLKQQLTTPFLSEKERFDISMYKGGISVLIDRFLVDKEPSKDEIKFFLGYGLILQLADDLQDILTDKALGYQTLFTICETKKETETRINQLFSYTKLLFDTAPKEFMDDGKLPFNQFLCKSCYLLYISSLLGVKTAVSEEYLMKFEKYMPVHLTYWEHLKAQISNQKDGFDDNTIYDFIDQVLLG